MTQQGGSDALFFKVAKNRYPLSENIGAATFWTSEHTTLRDGTPSAGSYVPRPDRSLHTLQWLSLLGFVGADHFYIRSPGTAIAKLLTLGGFGFWWIWDIVQTWAESERVLAYGMTTPFDIIKGIGQGMITDLKTSYTQKNSFSGWLAALMIGFTGADMLALGRGWQAFRKMLILFISLVTLVPSAIKLSQKGIGETLEGASIFGIFVGVCFFFLFIVGIGGMWVSDIYRVISNPKQILGSGEGSGLPVPKVSQDFLHYFKRLYEDEKGNVDPQFAGEYENIKRQWMFFGITGEELRNKFWISYEGKDMPEAKYETGTGVPIFTLAIHAFTKFLKWIMEGIIFLVGMFTGGNILNKGLELTAMKNPLDKITNAVAKGSSALNTASSAIAKGSALVSDVAETGAKLTNTASSAIAKGSAIVSDVAETGAKLTNTASSTIAKGSALVADTGAKLTNAVDTATRAATQLPNVVQNTTNVQGKRNTPAPQNAVMPNTAAPNTLEPKTENTQRGGGKVTTESKILGVAAVAIVGGSALKFLIDNLVTE
jgi:hypothetical protein